MAKSRLSSKRNLVVGFIFLSIIGSIFFYLRKDNNSKNSNSLLFFPITNKYSSLKTEEREIVDLNWKLTLEKELVSELRRRLLGKSLLEEDYFEAKKEGRGGGFTTTSLAKRAPIATISCNSSDAESRICRIKNLFYSKKRDIFFIYKDSTTLQILLPSNRTYAVDLCTIAGHNKFYFDFEEVSPSIFQEQQISFVEKLTFMVSRFHAYNIMHTIHDDFLGLYALHKMFAPPPPINDFDSSNGNAQFSKDNNILFLEGFPKLRYDGIFDTLTINPLLYKENLKTDKSDVDLICFRDAIVGNSKHGTWYTYGFLEPQGPIPNKMTSAHFLEDSATFLVESFEIINNNNARIMEELERIVLLSNEKPKIKVSLQERPIFITFISRTIDRLILNEREVMAALEERYSLMVKVVRMEDMSLKYQASIIRNSLLIIGAHGSALILGMFLPPGATLIELFPYGVPPENYTPYKKMCELHGSRLTYRSWVCTNESDSVGHPNRAPSGGGIKHLEMEEQRKILENPTVPEHLCCSNPYWLYRIYQDTKVNINELFEIIDSALPEALEKGKMNADQGIFFRAPIIEDIFADVDVDDSNIYVGGEQEFMIRIKWPLPWNGIKPTKYGVWVHQKFKEFYCESNSIAMSCKLNDRIDFWVRSWVMGEGGVEGNGSYSKKYTIFCRPGEVALQNDLFE